MLERSGGLDRCLEETIQVIAARTTLRPKLGVMVGSGLGGIAKAVQVDAEMKYEELPHMPRSTAPGHEGTLLIGQMSNVPLAVCAGRFHYYEGYTMPQVTYPVRLLRALGVETLILTSIVGSMNPAMPAGSLVVLKDHINLMGANPLIGPNDEQVGSRFPDMSEPYDPALRKLAHAVAETMTITLREVVYAAVAGPNLETKAEYRFLRQIGSDVVGMSTVPEVLVARHGGLRVLAIAVVSDMCIPETLKPASVEELLRVANAAEPRLTALVCGLIAQL